MGMLRQGHECKPPNTYKHFFGVFTNEEVGALWECDECGRVWEVVWNWKSQGYREWNSASRRTIKRFRRETEREQARLRLAAEDLLKDVQAT